MAERIINSSWVDRYIRDELSADDEIAFEERLLDDQELQQELEAALAIQETLSRSDLSDVVVAHSASKLATNSWTPFAMAASVLLAVASTTLLWRANIESDNLRHQLEELGQPRSSVLMVPVDIMRSAGMATPDVIILKPGGQAIIALDIELSARFHPLESISFELRDEKNLGETLEWSSSPTSDGRAQVFLHSESIPEGRVILTMSGPDGQPKETRLLEFLPAAK